MVVNPIRVTAVLTHPVQYYAPWFRWVHANCPDLDLHVIYASSPTPRQQGIGFDREFAWDVPLTDGYDCTVVRAARPADRFDSEHFWGLNVPEIADAIADRRPDVVVVFGWYSVTLVRAIRAARRLKIPVLYYGDTNLMSAPAGWRRALWVAKTRRLLSGFSGYLSVGIRSAAFLRFFGVPDGLIFATPHAVDNDRFSEAGSLRACASRRADTRHQLGLPADAFVVLFAGKLEPKKRPLDLAEALGRMHPRPHLAIAGAGALEVDVREAAERLGVGCSMLGFVNQSEMQHVYAASDCLALPSDTRETWGLVVNEALAAGLPCVVADTVGCAPDLVGPETGGVYPTAEPTELVNGFAAALSGVRDRLQAGHDFTAACQSRAFTHSFGQATAGLVRGCRTVSQATAVPARTQTGKGAGVRVVACCGGMVLVGGLERMTFEILQGVRDRGGVVHCIVNGWDHSRIVAMAERLGASWSIGYYWYTFTRRTRNPFTMATIVWDTLCTSAGLLRDAWWFRASHIFVSDYVTALRNAPALLLLRLSGRRVVLRLGNAPDEGRFFRWVWRCGVNPFVDVFVCNSQFTERALAAHGIAASKRMTIAHTPPTRPAIAPLIAPKDPGRVIYVGQIIPEKGIDLLLDAIGLLVGRGRDVRLDVVGHIDGWAPPEHERYRASLIAARRGAGFAGPRSLSRAARRRASPPADGGDPLLSFTQGAAGSLRHRRDRSETGRHPVRGHAERSARRAHRPRRGRVGVPRRDARGSRRGSRVLSRPRPPGARDGGGAQVGLGVQPRSVRSVVACGVRAVSGLRRLRISFFVHDLASNPIGRAFPIAQALSRDFDVEILGLLLSGDDVYLPYRHLADYRTIRSSRDVHAVLRAGRALAAQATGDVMYAFKPLLTSFGPALWASGFGRRSPLLLDVEDDEWVPMGTSGVDFLWRDLIRGWRHATAWKYTRLIHPLTACASGVTVASRALQRRYGGERLLHGPDEVAFDPDRADLETPECRRAFGLPALGRLALFSGLPQPHKGWDVLLNALTRPEASDWGLVLVGDREHPEFQRAAARLQGRCYRLGYVPYPEQPRLLAAVDAVPVPQLAVRFAQSQVSAKALDALAMRCPLIASRVGDFPEILAADSDEPRGWLVEPGDAADLARAFRTVSRDHADARRRTMRGRHWFLREASASAIRERFSRLLAVSSAAA